MSQLVFGLQIITLIAAVAVFVILLMTRSKEHPRFFVGFNFIVLGVFVLIISLLIQLALSIRELFKILLLPANVIETLSLADSIVLLPLMALCFLLGILLVRDRFTA